jgi:mono/diheme cytochrome c family protein
MRSRRSVRRAALLAAAVLLAGCGEDSKPAPTAAPPSGPPAPAATGAVADATKGRQVWIAQCVACHNNDPARDGPLGPAVKGSSRELLEARVLRSEYPPGYRPKRDSRVMPPRPDLKDSIPDLAAYLR